MEPRGPLPVRAGNPGPGKPRAGLRLRPLPLFLSHPRLGEVTSSLERLKSQNSEKAKTVEILTQKLEGLVRDRAGVGRIGVGQQLAGQGRATL